MQISPIRIRSPHAPCNFSIALSTAFSFAFTIGAFRCKSQRIHPMALILRKLKNRSFRTFPAVFFEFSDGPMSVCQHKTHFFLPPHQTSVATLTLVDKEKKQQKISFGERKTFFRFPPFFVFSSKNCGKFKR